jgi:hypothetical protein
MFGPSRILPEEAWSVSPFHGDMLRWQIRPGSVLPLELYLTQLGQFR